MRLYGIAEIAAVLEARPATISQWYRRGKLPPPDVILAMGPVWAHDTLAGFGSSVRTAFQNLDRRPS